MIKTQTAQALPALTKAGIVMGVYSAAMEGASALYGFLHWFVPPFLS